MSIALNLKISNYSLYAQTLICESILALWHLLRCQISTSIRNTDSLNQLFQSIFVHMLIYAYTLICLYAYMLQMIFLAKNYIKSIFLIRNMYLLTFRPIKIFFLAKNKFKSIFMIRDIYLLICITFIYCFHPLIWTYPYTLKIFFA